MTVRLIKLDPWVKEIIVDPLSKEPLALDEGHNYLWSPYGRKYPVIDELFDLRVLSNKTTRDQKIWIEGQRQYEKMSQNYSAYDHAQNYFAEIEGIREVYEDIPVEGSCLDVGGHQGRLRQFLSPGQNYVSCDPFLT